MTAVAERIRRERAFHDEEARRRAVTFASEPHRLRFEDNEYINHQPWVRPAIDMLGPVRNRQVLDLGCGHGMAAVVLARRGASVAACDVSPGYVTEAGRRARANGVNVNVFTCDAERLPFADKSFDAIWGHAILHHLDVASAAREVRRVLRPGGVAVFCEPWDGNPLVRLLRRWRRHTADERALDSSGLRCLSQPFRTVEVKKYQLGRYVVIATAG